MFFNPNAYFIFFVQGSATLKQPYRFYATDYFQFQHLLSFFFMKIGDTQAALLSL